MNDVQQNANLLNVREHDKTIIVLQKRAISRKFGLTPVQSESGMRGTKFNCWFDILEIINLHEIESNQLICDAR